MKKIIMLEKVMKDATMVSEPIAEFNDEGPECVVSANIINRFADILNNEVVDIVHMAEDTNVRTFKYVVKRIKYQ